MILIVSVGFVCCPGVIGLVADGFVGLIFFVVGIVSSSVVVDAVVEYVVENVVDVVVSFTGFYKRFQQKICSYSGIVAYLEPFPVVVDAVKL